MAFDRRGKFLRAWGQGMFKTTHFLRVDHSGYVWVTDRGDMQAFKFDSGGKLMMTLGRKGITGDNNSEDAFNGMADLAVATNGVLLGTLEVGQTSAAFPVIVDRRVDVELRATSVRRAGGRAVFFARADSLAA